MKTPVTGSFELIKNLNTACILNAIREKEPISRADIARKTGLTPATVSNITAELIDLGLIGETERGESNGGRKPVMLMIRPHVCYCGAVHISSNFIEVAVTDINATVVWSENRPLQRGIRPDEAIRLVIELLYKAQAFVPVGKKMVGIGICVHGLVQIEEGVMLFAPNLGWENVRIGDLIQTEFNLPVYVENDVRAMALAESWCGLARNAVDFVYLYIGTGIGGSIMFNNELYKGYGGFAGEFGHSTIEPDGPLCTCGNRGCLQAYASENTVFKNYCARKGITEEDLEYADVISLAKNGDEAALDEILKSVRYIGIEVGNIINAFSPSLIILNGNIVKLGNVVMIALDNEINAHVLKYTHSRTRIVFSRLSDRAPIRGAASCVIRDLFEYPRRFLQ
ncbi:MAG: ROK family transcriptional regulator [Clostridia bacterium]|nr:ROK family transcriptional regulator [Clostridia bacterium]MDR3643846.1 ROK family transcriptional regulator [Clostridia bacterium]